MKPVTLFIIAIILLLAWLFLPELSVAQTPPTLPAKPTQNPVDGGLALLAAAGGAYAINKLRNRTE